MDSGTSPSPGVCPSSCSLNWWCHPTISSSVVPFCSCLQSFPASGSFPMSWLFASDCQSIGASASASVLPMSIQNWFPLGLTSLVFLQSKGLLRVFSNTTVWHSALFVVQLSHPYMTTGKTIALTRQTFVVICVDSYENISVFCLKDFLGYLFIARCTYSFLQPLVTTH